MRRVVLLAASLLAAVTVLLPTHAAMATAGGSNGVQVTSKDGRAVCAAYASEAVVRTMVLLAESGGFAIDGHGQVRVSKDYRDQGGWCDTTLPASSKCWAVAGGITAGGVPYAEAVVRKPCPK